MAETVTNATKGSSSGTADSLIGRPIDRIDGALKVTGGQPTLMSMRRAPHPPMAIFSALRSQRAASSRSIRRMQSGHRASSTS